MPLREGLRASRLHPQGPLKAFVDRLCRHQWIDSTLSTIRNLAQEWRDDRITGLAAEVAFFAMLALFPALLATTALLGSLEGVAGKELAAEAQSQVLAFLDRVFTDDADDVVRTVRELFAERSPGILTVGVLGAVFAAARGFVGVIRALDVAYDLTEQRSWLRILPTAVLLAVGSVVVLVVVLSMVVLGPVLGSGQELARIVGLGDAFTAFWNLLRAPFAFLVLVLWATTLFHLGPDHRSAWRRHLPGALLSAVLWLFVSLGFRLYLVVASGGNAVFGVLGGALTLLIWLYLLGIGLLVGAELNAVLARRRSSRSAKGYLGVSPVS